jgi:hypothetical protein
MPDFGRLAAAGVDPKVVDVLIKDWELRNPQMQVNGGYAYNPRAIQPGFLPQINVSQDGKGIGITPGANGGLPSIAPLPGSLNTYTDFQKAGERAKAGFTPFTMQVPGGSQQVPLDVGMDILRGIQSGGTQRSDGA